MLLEFAINITQEHDRCTLADSTAGNLLNQVLRICYLRALEFNEPLQPV
jgi:hypothetical protein